MGWRRCSSNISVECDVELSSIRVERLLQALIENKVMSEDEASLFLDRHNGEQEARFRKLTIDPDEFAEAMNALQARRKADAILHLERALPREWRGVLTGGG